MGHVGDGLHQLFVVDVPDLVEQQREHQRRREADEQGQGVQGQGVADVLPQFGRSQQTFEPLDAHILGAIEALEQLIVIKRRAQVIHGHVFEQRQVYQHGDHHHIDIAVLPDLVGDPFADGRRCEHRPSAFFNLPCGCDRMICQAQRLFLCRYNT